MEDIIEFQHEIKLICDSPFTGEERTQMINKTFKYYRTLIRTHPLQDFPELIALIGIYNEETQTMCFDDDLVNAYLETIK